MTNWQKRLVIGFNIAALFIFLDVSLLIFIRSVNGHGIYQTLGMKWLTFSVMLPYGWSKELLICLLNVSPWQKNSEIVAEY